MCICVYESIKEPKDRHSKHSRWITSRGCSRPFRSCCLCTLCGGDWVCIHFPSFRRLDFVLPSNGSLLFFRWVHVIPSTLLDTLASRVNPPLPDSCAHDPLSLSVVTTEISKGHRRSQKSPLRCARRSRCGFKQAKTDAFGVVVHSGVARWCVSVTIETMTRRETYWSTRVVSLFFFGWFWMRGN